MLSNVFFVNAIVSSQPIETRVPLSAKHSPAICDLCTIGEIRSEMPVATSQRATKNYFRKNIFLTRVLRNFFFLLILF